MGGRMPDVVELAQKLVRYDTVGGRNERRVLEEIADMLREAGFCCVFDDYAPHLPDRTSLCASLNRESPAPGFFMGGHIDTVPFGDAPWKLDPLSGDICGDALYGRGSCDMKSGVAAMVCAALSCAGKIGKKSLILHIYGGEETGCLGSFHAALRPELFGRAGAGIIAEPSGNMPYAGHKGALWLTVETAGRAAHGSMPEQGVNALAALLPGACRLLEAKPDAAHPVLGQCTLALTSLHSGLNPNSIPDKAVLTLDTRTVPGQSHAELRRGFAETAGPEALFRTVLDVEPVWTDPDLPWCAHVRRRLREFLGREPGVTGVPFFTDAAAVRSVLPDIPLLILGPGPSSEAHKTDEHCPVEQIRTAARIYEALLMDWFQS